jgi:hypothetical protein
MSLLTVAEIEQRLRDNAAAIGRQMLPGAREEGGKYLVCGDVTGAAGDSLVLHISGTKAGLWKDWAANEGGDMLDLIGATQGLTGKAEQVAMAKRLLGIEDQWSPRGAAPDPAEQARRAEQLRQMRARRQAEQLVERQKSIKRAKGLYLSAVPIAGTPAEGYLLARGLRPLGGSASPDGSATARHAAKVENAGWPNALRYHAEVWNGDVGGKRPALVAPIMIASGEQVATHRIWLAHDEARGWIKLDVPKPKKVMGPMWGGFVPIAKGASGRPMSRMPEDEPVYVTEGIEDALVVRMARPGARVIAAVALGNIGAIVLPAAARRLVIVADRDDKQAAIDALERSIAAQQARGLDVRLCMPPVEFKDLNDWLLGKGKASGELAA